MAGSSVSESDSGPFVWTLYGDPGSGAAISYEGSDEFSVSGRYVMTPTYTAPGGLSGGFPQVVLVAEAYQAVVRWLPTTHRTKLVSLSASAGGPQIPFPNGDWRGEAISAARKAFQRCARSTVFGTLGCPQQQAVNSWSPTEIQSASYHFAYDPLRNATETYDPGTGLVHVIGQLNLDIRYATTVVGCCFHIPKIGTYDAALVPVPGGLRVVLIWLPNQ